MHQLARRVLVVEDSEPFRRFICSTLQKRQDLQIIGEALDGLDAVQKAQELQPDLVLLDIGLPKLNGIEAARRIRECLPNSKILFLSEHRSLDIVEAAFRTGAMGYVVKSDAAADLLPAVEAVLHDGRFLSASLAGRGLTVPTDEHSAIPARVNDVVAPKQRRTSEIAGHHEVGFYSDDERLLDDLAQFIGTALKNGNAAIVVATPSHRDSLLAALQMNGLNVGAAIEQGTYVALDAADTLAAVMIDGMPDPVRFLKLLGGLILTMAEAVKTHHPEKQGQVAIFGECVNLLWAQGKEEAAIEFERLGNRLLNVYDVQILCGYSLHSVPGGMPDSMFARVCAEHSAVHFLSPL